MIRTEGPRSLYNGLVAGLQRQMAFASIRIGLYDNVKSFYTGGKDSELRGIGFLLYLVSASFKSLILSLFSLFSFVALQE